MKETRIMTNVHNRNDMDEALKVARRNTGYYEHHEKRRKQACSVVELEAWIREAKAKNF
ncbi:hypothetical protein JOC55_002208 [Paenibacillus sacheonensis]|nr:hypothetical protein [Paenibacillus sacheonensis]